MEQMTNKKPRYNEIVFTEEQQTQIIDMYINQNMSTVKIGNIFNCGNKVIAKVLEKHSVPRTGVGRRKYSLNEYYFDEIDTPIKAYILGFFYADGCNYKPKQTISMSLQEDDKDILERIRNEIGSERQLEFLDYTNKHDFGYNYKNQYRLLLFSAHMCRTLEKKGMSPNKSLILEFPEWLDENLYSHFIRGYFDGDGSVVFPTYSDSAIITITSTEKFCTFIKDYLEKTLSIRGYITDASNHNGITKVFGIGNKQKVKTFLDWLYKDADIYLERKYQRYINKYYNSSQVA